MLKDGFATAHPFLRFFFRYKSPRKRFVKRGTVSGAAALSARKQAAIESLCHKLFQKEELITSGKLQLLGLAKVKKRMGRRWGGLQTVVYEICDAAMNKYSSPGDIFLRYRDDSYLMLFMTSSAEEIALRTRMISEEIKRQLFEQAGIEDIDVVAQVSGIKGKRLNMEKAFPDAIEEAFDDPSQELAFAPTDPALPINRMEIDAFADPERQIGDLDLGVDSKSPLNIRVQYMPVWDQYKKRLISYLCLPGSSHDTHDLLYEYMQLCQGLSVARKADLDTAIMAQVVDWLTHHAAALGSFGIICPVHYDTLLGGESRELYKKVCQQIDEHMKQYVLFMVMDVPQAPWVSLGQVVSPLKTYGRVLCAKVDLYGPVDFEALRMSGFDHVGVLMPAHKPKESMKRSLMDVRSFVGRARKHLMKKVFVLGVNDPVTAGMLAQMDIRFMAGGAISDCLDAPAPRLDFWKNKVFCDWQRIIGQGSNMTY